MAWIKKRKMLYYSNFVWEQNYYRMLGSALSRDSRFSRLGTETPRLSVWVSSRNRSRYRNSGLRSLGISLGTETQIIKVSESEPESWFKEGPLFLNFNPFFLTKSALFIKKNRPFQVKISGIGIEIARLSAIIQEPDSEPESMFRISYSYI